MILVTGATGQIGRELVRLLVERGEPVRGFVRDPERARALLGDQLQLAVGDTADPGSFQEALTGVDRLFLLTADSNASGFEQQAAAAAHRAGVRQVVKLSALGVHDLDTFPLLAGHAAGEQAVRAAGPAWTMLRPGGFASYWLRDPAVFTSGRIAAPAGEGRVAWIDPRDIAAFAAHVLSTDGHTAQVYDLTGPQALDYHATAAALAAGVGRPVRYEPVDEQTFTDTLTASGVPQQMLPGLLAFFAAIRADRMSTVTTTLSEVAGVQPRTLADFARDHAGQLAATA